MELRRKVTPGDFRLGVFKTPEASKSGANPHRRSEGDTWPKISVVHRLEKGGGRS